MLLLATIGRPRPRQAIAALEAGQVAGGDKRGKQSAAIKVWHAEPYAVLDFRSDDHAEPLAELRRLYDLARQRYIAIMETVASRTHPGGLFETAERDRFLARHGVSVTEI